MNQHDFSEKNNHENNPQGAGQQSIKNHGSGIKMQFVIALFMLIPLSSNAQLLDSIKRYQITPGNITSNSSKLNIGGYAQMEYIQPIDKETSYNGNLDIHRIVMLLGYRFNDKVLFASEIEYEHVKQLYVEYAFLQYSVNKYLNFKGGLLLTPVGIINEYHEPPLFNGVLRPKTDKYIAPTTWREIGAGITGNFPRQSFKYQLYVMNGFSSFNNEGATLQGSNGFRSGRQKGAKSFMSSPNLTGKLEYYGIKGLNIGLSGYFGKTQSMLYDNLDKDNSNARAIADSSVVGISMIGLDARYSIQGLELRGQYYYADISNTESYNYFTASNGIPNNIGSSLLGYYMEAGYNVFTPAPDIDSELTPFVRYTRYNTHHSVEDDFAKIDAFNNQVITTGIGWKMSPGAVVKTDLQFLKSKATGSNRVNVNVGLGVMF